MSEKKISQVLDFPLPIYMKRLKSFLGLVNHFGPHIRNLSTVAHYLHGLLTNYNRGTVLKWTEETTTDFKILTSLVEDCPTMFFVDPDLPIHLRNDALDYGIGGYLF
jgi:hypothetical protein